MMELAGDPKYTKYLFLGDYVDRGLFSTECLLYLLCLKIQYPSTFNMLRGNHECRSLTAYYNFKVETLRKYNSLEAYKAYGDLFDTLPIACIINCARLGKFFAVHAGISPSATVIE